MRVLWYRHNPRLASEPHVLAMAGDWSGPSAILDGRGGLTDPTEAARNRSAGLLGSLLAESSLRFTMRSALHSRAVRQVSPDFIVAHTAMDGLRISSVAKNLNLPLAVICHGSDILASNASLKEISYSGRQLAKHWNLLADRCAVFLPVSSYLERELLNRYVGSATVVRHYLGTDIPMDVPPLHLRDRDILFVGRMEENKGPDRFVNLVRRLHESGVVSSATMIGSGSRYGQVAESIVTQGLSEVIRLLPARSHDEVREMMGQHRLLVVPSIGLASGVSEGFGLTSIEAQALGTPVVVSETGGLPVTVNPGISGFVTSSNDEMFAACCGVLTDAQLWLSMSMAARLWTSHNFDRCARQQELKLVLEGVASRFYGSGNQ